VATDATFSIDFPSQTTLDTEPISSEDGTTIDSLTIFAQPTKYTAYSCTYIDKKYAPESSPQKILESARDGSLTKLKGTVISQKNMVIQGFPALDTQAHARDNMLVDLRLILVKDRMFMLMTMASSEENQESKTNQRFFDSFKILRNQ
jgi:predicted Zn-dependent protease